MPRKSEELVDALSFVPDAVLDVRYATAKNPAGRPLYPFAAVFLKEGTARKLAAAAGALRARGLRLVLFDGYRPLSVQRALWQALPDPRFVADPARGSNHNRGCAVDAGLCGAVGRPVELPSDFDDFSRGAEPWPHASPAARQNVSVLRGAMRAAGFSPIASEWWHFVDRDGAAAPALDRPFESLRP